MAPTLSAPEASCDDYTRECSKSGTVYNDRPTRSLNNNTSPSNNTSPTFRSPPPPSPPPPTSSPISYSAPPPSVRLHLKGVAPVSSARPRNQGADFSGDFLSNHKSTGSQHTATIIGFCYKRKRVLIYEYMPNGSLDKLIYNQGSSDANSCQLEWKMLYEIALGIARGLEYLHRGCNTRILHFDIKPHNILLDDNFCAKIADFGLAKLSKRDQSTVSVLGQRGTRGYIAPEVCSNHFGRVSFKSDVYSYGMMVLEMVGKRKNMDPNVSQISRIYFPHYIYKHVEARSDLDFDGIKNEEEEEIAKKMILVSLWCIQTNPSNRPSMSGVIEMLQSGLQSLPFPPNPFLSSPTTSPEHSGALD